MRGESVVASITLVKWNGSGRAPFCTSIIEFSMYELDYITDLWVKYNLVQSAQYLYAILATKRAYRGRSPGGPITLFQPPVELHLTWSTHPASLD